MSNKERLRNRTNIKELEVSPPRPGPHMLGADRDRFLNCMGFRNLRELLEYEPLRCARTLSAVARGLIPEPPLDGLVKAEYIRKDATGAVAWPVTALAQMTEDKALVLSSMGIKTIDDLVQLAAEADQAVWAGLKDNGFRERPSAPAELLPGMYGSISSSVRFTTFIRDTEVRRLRFKVHEDCVIPLPLGPTKNSLGEIFEGQKCPVVHLGYMCDHRQRWINLGTSLGEVVHTLSLGAGETRNVAMVNWRRRQLTALKEQTQTSERLTATFVQNRALEEITSAVAREHQGGNTQTESNTAVTAAGVVGALALAGGITGGIIGTVVEPGVGTLIGAAVGAGAGVAAGGLVYAGAQALGKIEADTKGDRNIVADVQQRISLSTSQNASVARSLWSTAVVEDAQAEGVEATTSNITNYNHMHTLNIEYREVLQHYLVRLDVERVQPILFLPFTFFDFTGFRFVRDYWDAVRLYVDDEGLRTQGDAYFVTEGVPEAPDLLPVPPEPTPPTPQSPPKITDLKIEVLFDSLPGNTNVGLVLLRGDTEISPDSEDDSDFPGDIDGYEWVNRYTFDDIQDAHEITGVRMSRSQAISSDLKYHIRVQGGKVRKSTNIVLENLKGDVIAENKTIRGSNSNTTFRLDWSPADQYAPGDGEADGEYRQAVLARAKVIAQNAMRQAAYQNLLDNIDRFEKRLEQLILRRRHFFTRVILNAIEPEEIIQLLEALMIVHADHPQTKVKLSNIADTIPLGMTTGALVLKLKRYERRKSNTRREPQRADNGRALLTKLSEYSDGTLDHFEAAERKQALMRTDHVYVPTGGLFAEALLGRANSAEYLDMERYFNWQDSQIPHQAPAIQPVGTESRFQQGEVSVHVPEGNLQVINPVSLPDPTGLQGVLTAIQNPNLFRDMSKASELANIIGSLSTLAGQMGQAASSMTGQAAQQALQAATEVGRTAAGMAQSLVNQAFSQTGGAPASMTSQGAALNKARELIRAGEGGDGTPTVAPPDAPGTSAPSAAPTSSLVEEILRKGQGLPLNGHFPSNAQATDAAGAVTSVGFFDNVEAVTAHISEWLSALLDASDPKPQMHINNTPLRRADFPMAQSVAKLVKVQRHRLKFKAPGKTLDDVANAVGDFANLVAYTNLTCARLAGAGAIRVNDRFRFRVTGGIQGMAFANILRLIGTSAVKANIPPGFFLELSGIVGELVNSFGRRFDVEVVSSSRDAQEVGWAVQTLSNHPYAGRRAWLIRESAANEFFCETAEFNGWGWLIDCLVELQLGQSPDTDFAGLTWEHFLNNLMHTLGGTVLDDSELHFPPKLIADWRSIRNQLLVQEVLAAHPALQEEANRLETFT